MALDSAQVGYFITQVGLAAASFGVAQSDVTLVGNTLVKVFDYRCAPPTIVIPSQGAQLQSICTANDCMISPNSTCSSYSAAISPAVANSTLASSGNSSASSSSSMSSTSSTSGSGASASAFKGDASAVSGNTGIISTLMGVVALIFAL